MNIFGSFLEKVRNSPDSIKKKWVIRFSIFSGIIVFVFWIFCVADSIHSVSEIPRVELDNTSPIEAIKNTFNGTANTLNSGIKNINDQINIGRTVEIK